MNLDVIRGPICVSMAPAWRALLFVITFTSLFSSANASSLKEIFLSSSPSSRIIPSLSLITSHRL